ncbi:MAG: hypothetical protein DI535_17645 [Citrobacter freundii]|nr:MAG: hypothetical protein DI535_17645 [Citrobacter freundii]
MKAILVPVDFSPASFDAARYALDLANKIQGRVSLVHICDLPGGGIDVPYTDKQVEDKIQKATLKMKHFLAALALLPGGDKLTDTIVQGQFTEELQRICETERPFMVVMQAHHETGIQQLFTGEDMSTLLRTLDFPVLIIPPGKNFEGIRNVALACDMENIQETIPVKFIGTLLKALNASLSVIHIDTRNRYDSEFTIQSQQLQQLLSPYRPSYHFLSKVQVEEGLLSFIDKNNVDMLIMLPGKHHLLSRLIHGSHTATMALYSHVPVLSLHEN